MEFQAQPFTISEPAGLETPWNQTGSNVQI